MAVSTAALEGAAAGWAVLAMVTLFSLARGLCSVAAKDVLGKTVSKTRRGALMGYSAAAAGVVTLLIGGYVELFGGRKLGADFFMTMLFAAAAVWLLAMTVFAAIREEPGATEGGGNAVVTALRSLALLRTDGALRRYVIARALLLSVALAPPFYVLLAQQRSTGVTGLGLLIIASGLAASLSAPLWGRMGDRSSRRVMVIAAAAAGMTGLITWLFDRSGVQVMDSPWTYAVLFLLIAVFHSGVRLGRKIYLVDMASQATLPQLQWRSSLGRGFLRLFHHTVLFGLCQDGRSGVVAGFSRLELMEQFSAAPHKGARATCGTRWYCHGDEDARQRGVYTRPKHGQRHETAAGEIDDGTPHSQGGQDQERSESM
jgi:hypothetical protein